MSAKPTCSVFFFNCRSKMPKKKGGKGKKGKKGKKDVDEGPQVLCLS
jgi:hypothetical protein